ncbi:hypothetical protein [Paenibacillus camerounensis]|nr:hypothetical protein [Paenibacillus camerounensis]
MENNKSELMELAINKTEQEDIFEPVLGELVSDDSFAFTLLSCHC